MGLKKTKSEEDLQIYTLTEGELKKKKKKKVLIIIN